MLYAIVHRVVLTEGRAPVYHLAHPHFPGSARCIPSLPLDLNTMSESIPPEGAYCRQCNARLPITRAGIVADEVVRRFAWVFPPESCKEDARRARDGKEPRDWAPTRKMAIEQASTKSRHDT
jgi:hypothetical protein